MRIWSMQYLHMNKGNNLGNIPVGGKAYSGAENCQNVTLIFFFSYKIAYEYVMVGCGDAGKGRARLTYTNYHLHIQTQNKANMSWHQFNSFNLHIIRQN